MSKYKIAIEIEAPFAMFSRPDTGATPTSYPMPTFSAAKGIFESIVFFENAQALIRPTHVEICKKVGTIGGEIQFQNYKNNYHGPLTKTNKDNFQLSSLILSNICYRIYAVIESGRDEPLRLGNNPCHALQAMFERRLKKGQCYKTPSLGWNEFVPSYWGPLRDSIDAMPYQTEIDQDINLNLISVLHQVFNKSISGQYGPTFVQGEKAFIKNGVFYYA